jgi:hypothetical protein
MPIFRCFCLFLIVNGLLRNIYLATRKVLTNKRFLDFLALSINLWGNSEAKSLDGHLDQNRECRNENSSHYGRSLTRDTLTERQLASLLILKLPRLDRNFLIRASFWLLCISTTISIIFDCSKGAWSIRRNTWKFFRYSGSIYVWLKRVSYPSWFTLMTNV